MKKFLTIALSALLCVGAYAQNGYASKDVNSPVFNTSSTPTLNTTTKHTNVDVTVWDKSAIQASAKVNVGCTSDAQAKKILDCIDVKMSQSGNVVTIVTTFNSDAIEAITGKNGKRSYDINISVKVPASTLMNFENKYGNVTVESTKSKLNALLKYGNLTVGQIGLPSVIEIKYGNVEIKKASDLNLIIKYGDATIGEMGDMRMDSGYGNFRLGTVGKFSGVVKYDSYKFDAVKSIDIDDCKYTNVTIGKLAESLSIGDLAYGELRVGAVCPTFSWVNVEARYSDIRIGFVAPVVFKADLSTKYANIDVDELNGKITNLNSGGSTTAFTFTAGNSTDTKVRISNSYANIRLTKSF